MSMIYLLPVLKRKAPWLQEGMSTSEDCLEVKENGADVGARENIYFPYIWVPFRLLWSFPKHGNKAGIRKIRKGRENLGGEQKHCDAVEK